MAVVGRPSSYSDEIADEICEAIATGGALYILCAENGHWPAEGTIYQWVNRYPEFAEKYARARDRQADRRNEEIVVIADTCEDPQKARLQIDARKWQASKLAPKKYGDKVLNEHSGPNGAPIQTQSTVLDATSLTMEERQKMREILQAAAERKG